MYSIYHRLEKGVWGEKDQKEWQEDAQKAMAQFCLQYSYSNSVRVYEHLIIFHGLELQAELPDGLTLGNCSNQLVEHEHHMHNLGAAHSFLGSRLCGKCGSEYLKTTDRIFELVLLNYLHKVVDRWKQPMVVKCTQGGSRTTTRKMPCPVPPPSPESIF